MKEISDWREVVERNPKGYVELNDGKRILHGPIESIRITPADDVEIKLKWTSLMPKLEFGVWAAEWEVAPNDPILFPNLMVPFVIEDMEEKGERVRFGSNILFFDDIRKLEPARVQGLDVSN